MMNEQRRRFFSESHLRYQGLEKGAEKMESWLIRLESKKKLQDIVDHLQGASHAAAMEKRELVRKWAAKDRSHPWVRTLQANDPGVVKSLIHMAVDVYNDSKLLTQSAWFWPSRSLAQLHAEEQFKTYGEHDAAPSRFQPSPTDLHYRDPVHYAEMLHIVATMEKEKLKKDLQNCLRFSVQIDGSVDAKQHDKKFVFIRFNKKDDPLSILAPFVSAKQVERRGAEGLFEAVITSLQDLGIAKEDMKSKFAGVTTDGESATLAVIVAACGLAWSST